MVVGARPAKGWSPGVRATLGWVPNRPRTVSCVRDASTQRLPPAGSGGEGQSDSTGRGRLTGPPSRAPSYTRHFIPASCVSGLLLELESHGRTPCLRRLFNFYRRDIPLFVGKKSIVNTYWGEISIRGEIESLEQLALYESHIQAPEQVSPLGTHNTDLESPCETPQCAWEATQGKKIKLRAGKFF